MDKLITHVPAADVTDDFKDLALTWPLWESRTHPQAPPKSGKFHFDYNGDYETERILVMSGKATLSPSDGSDPITIGEGDQVFFHKGFACDWHVTEPMKKHYAYYDEDEVEVAANPSIACDICEAECYEESYLTKEEEDICPDCYKADKKMYTGAEHQKFGEPIPTKKAAKREAPASNGNNKKAKAKKHVSEDEEEDEDEEEEEEEEVPTKGQNGANKKAKAKKQDSESEDEEDEDED